MANDRLPRAGEDFHAFIRRLHPKPKDQMSPAEHAAWYADCVDWMGYFGFRDAATGERESS
jgi:hypothetical protein